VKRTGVCSEAIVCPPRLRLVDAVDGRANLGFGHVGAVIVELRLRQRDLRLAVRTRGPRPRQRRLGRIHVLRRRHPPAARRAHGLQSRELGFGFDDGGLLFLEHGLGDLELGGRLQHLGRELRDVEPRQELALGDVVVVVDRHEIEDAGQLATDLHLVGRLQCPVALTVTTSRSISAGWSRTSSLARRRKTPTKARQVARRAWQCRPAPPVGRMALSR
jgi:hypothetical protein